MYIEYAAIKYPDGEIMTARRHYKIIQLQAKFGIRTGGDCVQGFLDTAGNFLTRDEAKEVAIKAGQVPADFQGTLYSEDIWPDNFEKMIGAQ